MTSSGDMWSAQDWLQKHPWQGTVAQLSCECGTWKQTETTIQSKREMRKEIERPLKVGTMVILYCKW